MNPPPVYDFRLVADIVNKHAQETQVAGTSIKRHNRGGGSRNTTRDIFSRKGFGSTPGPGSSSPIASPSGAVTSSNSTGLTSRSFSFSAASRKGVFGTTGPHQRKQQETYKGVIGNSGPRQGKQQETSWDSTRSASDSPWGSGAPQSPDVKQSPTVICYICGHEYGPQSIGIHEKQCMVKWRRENYELPENMRRPEPVKPEILKADLPSASAESGGVAAESDNRDITGSGKYNLVAAYASAQGQYIACSKCGRTFQPDRLDLHQRNCRGPVKKRA